ncbi:hypothetical protein GCM10010446_20300 [Streptomyces enissocaesilis]|uniref:Uncharacterized protein n=1 Tax=Streptomyces enissocaesilis TaxID=332589 RepID=A0ABN3X4L2_9ACTN
MGLPGRARDPARLTGARTEDLREWHALLRAGEAGDPRRAGEPAERGEAL